MQDWMEWPKPYCGTNEQTSLETEPTVLYKSCRLVINFKPRCWGGIAEAQRQLDLHITNLAVLFQLVITGRRTYWDFYIWPASLSAALYVQSLASMYLSYFGADFIHNVNLNLALENFKLHLCNTCKYYSRYFCTGQWLLL